MTNSKEINWPTQDLTECKGELIDVFEGIENSPFPNENDFVRYMNSNDNEDPNNLPF